MDKMEKSYTIIITRNINNYEIAMWILLCVLLNILLLISIIAFIYYIDKKRINKNSYNQILHISYIYSSMLKDILNSGIIPYNNYFIVVYTINPITFGYKFFSGEYLINWYDYNKLKDINYRSIELFNIEKLKLAESILRNSKVQTYSEIIFPEECNKYITTITYEVLELMLVKSKL
jgi:hypothetical protein